MFIKMIFFFVVAGWQLLLAKLLCVVFMPINSSSLWLRLAHTLAFARPTWLLDGIVIQWSLCDFSTTICSSVEVSGLYNHNCFPLWCLTTFSLCNTPQSFKNLIQILVVEQINCEVAFEEIRKWNSTFEFKMKREMKIKSLYCLI